MTEQEIKYRLEQLGKEMRITSMSETYENSVCFVCRKSRVDVDIVNVGVKRNTWVPVCATCVDRRQ